MVAKIVQGKGFRGVVNYVMDKQEAKLLYAEGVRLKDKESIIHSFITQSKLNPNISKPVAHISLDFSVQDKAKLTDEFMINVAQEYMKRMGYENTQYIVVRHHDTDHPHVHMVINRIDNDGKRISDQNERLRSTKICMELTKQHGLYIASGKESVKIHRLKGPDKSKYEIYNVLQSAVLKCKDWQQLKAELLKFVITTEFKYNGGTDKIQGVAFGKNGYVFNGSKVDRTCSYSKISYQLYQNGQGQAKEQSFKQLTPIQKENGSAIVEAAVSALGGLFDIQPSSGYDENEAEALRLERLKKKKKKGRRL